MRNLFTDFSWITKRLAIRTIRSQKRRRPTFRKSLEVLESRWLLTNVLTYHDDIASTGLNATETQLTPANVAVNAFGKLHSTALDGQVYAQPLVDTAITIAAGPNTRAGAAGLHDVVFVGTQHDSLYAIDATSTGGGVLWQRSFLDISVAANNTLNATAITSVPSGDTGSGDINPEVGITGTPVIDAATDTLYVVAKTKETISGVDHYVQRLHAIKLSDGTDRVTPYLIGDTAFGNTNSTAIYVYGSGDGSVTDPYNGTNRQVVQFNALREHQRGALNLVNNTLYVQWASHGDNGPYHGWVAKWDVATLNTNGFQLKGVLNTSPNNGLSGIWQGGGRLAFEPNGSAFYFETGNGYGGNPTLNANGFPTTANYNEALVKVVADTTTGPTHQNANGWGLKVADYFIPFNVNPLDGADSDFGSGAPIVLPDSAGIPGHPHLLVAGGKEGKLYLIDRDNLGHFDANNDHVLNAVPDGSGHNSPPAAISGLLSTPAYFNGKLYALSGYGGQGHSFTINANGTLTDTSQTAVGSFGYLPGSPSISANGTTNGIVWLMDRNANVLHAYDAATLATELWNSSQKVSGGDRVGAVVKFAVPTVANGLVYVGTTNSLVVYGVPVPPTSVPHAPTLSASTLSGSAVNLTWTDTSVAPNTADTYLIEKSTDGTNFSPVATAPAGANSIAIGGLQPLTHYEFRITGINSIGNSPVSNVAEATTTDQVSLLDFTGGFAGTNLLTLNGSASINGSRLEVTDLNGGEANSAFVNDRVDVTGFNSQFTFQITPNGDGIADGFTFTLQGVGANVVGFGGGSLGYESLGNSVAIKFDLYDNTGEGVNSTGLFTNGAAPFSDGSIDLSQTGIDLHSGHIFQANLNYDGTTLSVTIVDTQTQASATQNYTVDIPRIVGDPTAYVGFTGGTGGLVAVQDILAWTYSPNATTSPNAPSGLGATPASATSILLNWTNNANNQLGYHLDRATDSNFTQELVTQTLSANPSHFTDTADGLAPSGTYFYRLRAFNSVGDSDSSNSAQVTIPVAPPKPTLQRVDAVSDTEIDISWQDNAGHQADGYKILRSVNHGVFTTVATLPPTSRKAPSRYDYPDTDLTPGSLYEYHIVAFNVSGNNDFAGSNATTLTEPPGSPTATSGNKVVHLSWTAPAGSQSFNVYRGTAAGEEDSTPLITGLTYPNYDDTDVTIGATYYYTITAINANVDRDPVLPSQSAPSVEISATVLPPTPTGLMATVETNARTPRVILHWDAAAGIDSFNVYRSLSPNGAGGTPLATGLVDNSFTDAAVTFGTTYFYKVTAIQGAGESLFSNEASATPFFNVHVNFTNSTGDVVLGYLADAGLGFGSRENGLSFGWNRNETANGFDRDARNSPDERHDSFHNSHGPGANNAYWKIAVPNGTYSVHLIAGDPNDTTSLYRFNVGNGSTGGTTAINGRATTANRWLEGTVTVTITGGALFVSNGSGTSNNKLDAIDLTPVAPRVTSFSPASSTPGSTVTLTGSNFIGATTIRFNGLQTTFSVISATQIRTIVPANATSGLISVTTTGGMATSTTVFKVAPRISSFTSEDGAIGQTVIITGANFTGATSVKFHGTIASFTVNSATQITATVPASATTGTITVATRAGTATSAAAFVVAPRISNFASSSGVVGTTVTLRGENLTGATSVRFNGLEATFRVVSSTQIAAVLPAEATTGPITVITAAGFATSTTDFKVAPRITGFTPASGSAQSEVTITGANFTGTTSVKFHGTAVTFTIISATEITAILPNSFTTGRITIATAVGTATSANNFTRIP